VPLNTTRTVNDVVAQALCTGCGTCVAVCPQDAIQMKESPSGFLTPVIDPALCNDCGLCIKVCPGHHFEEGMIPEGLDPFAGPVRASYLVQHRQPDLLAAAQSGGAVAGLLLHLLESGRIDRALVTRMPANGSLRPYAILTGDPEVIRDSCGSKYCPIALNAQLREVSPTERIAVVGLSCHIHGVAHLCRHLPRWRRENLLLIGLVCDGTLSFRAMDYLVYRAGLCREEISSLLFRSKRRRGWPGEVLIITRQGNEFYLPARRRGECKDLFTPQRCRLCFDKMNVLSDITCADPYGVSKDPEGQSVVLIRTATGLAAMQSALQAGVFLSQDASADAIFAGQQIENRRRDCAAYFQAWRDWGHCAPCVPIADLHKEGIGGGHRRNGRYEKLLFELPAIAEADTTFQKSFRLIQRRRLGRLLNRACRLFLGKAAS